MELDPKKLQELCSLPDDLLRATVQRIAKSQGIALPSGAPSAAELQKIRLALSTPAGAESALQFFRSTQAKGGK